MTMAIYVPSLGRSNDIGWGVPRFASPALRARMIYVVPEGEGEQYRAALDKAEQSYPRLASARVLECPERGIAKTRLWIGAHASGTGADKFLMLDDDVWFYTRKTMEKENLDYSRPEQVDAMIAAVEAHLDDYGHVGISAREGNNRLGVGGPELKVENTRTLRALAYRTRDFLECEHGRVPVQEDFDVNLQLLEKGIPNCNLAFWSQGQRQTNAPGGCSSYRTHEVQDAAARRLAELHPGIVRLVEKKNKSGGEFGHRTEVVISWKKAYAQGQRSRGV